MYIAVKSINAPLTLYASLFDVFTAVNYHELSPIILQDIMIERPGDRLHIGYLYPKLYTYTKIYSSLTLLIDSGKLTHLKQTQHATSVANLDC